MIPTWLAMFVTLGVLIDAFYHHAYLASAFFVLTLRLAIVRVLQAHKLWG